MGCVEVVNHPIHWLYQQIVGVPPHGETLCYLCGGSCQEQHTVARGIAETFNSHYLARCPSSPWLCAACQWYFDSKAGHPDFRKMSLMVWREGWVSWQRHDMKQMLEHWLSHGTSEDYYLVVSLTKKKHILLQAPMNSKGTKVLSFQVEEQQAHIDQTTWCIMNNSFMHLLELGHNKGEILSGDLYGNTLRRHGQLKEALMHSRMLEPYRNSAALQLLSYVTIVEKESEETDDRRGENGASGQSDEVAQVDMGGDRPRIQDQVPSRDMAAIRESGSKRRTHDEHPDGVSQQTLW